MTALSPHKWGVVRLDYDLLLRRPCELVVSRHKTEVAARTFLTNSGKSTLQYRIRRLTESERLN